MECFYIGTRQKMFEVRAPSVNMPSSKQGFSAELLFLNGGASIRRSTASHKRYTLTWNAVERDDARIILDLADRLYGDGPFYWHDPFVADRNVLPQWWATPSQGLFDGLPLNAGVRGVAVPTPTNSLNFPSQSIRYSVEANKTRRVWLPIPPDHTAHVGVYGSDGTGGQVSVRGTISGEYFDPPTVLTLMDVNDDSRFNATFTHYATRDGIELYLSGAGTVTLSGMMVQVLPNGETPETGSFISGQGHSGLQFASQPSYTPYSAVFTRAGLSAEFVETGGWEEQ
jgi:hypothetical protein